MVETGWRHRDLTATIAEHFRGKNVLLFADCCYSGALEDVAKQLHGKGLRAASLTSASAFNVSTNNWTYTLSVVDLLRGQPLADANQDNVITLSEAAREVRQTMTHYERQRYGYARHGIPEDFQLARVRDRDPDHDEAKKDFGPFQRGQFVGARLGRKIRPARVLDASEANSPKQRLFLQFQDYNDRPLVWVLQEDVKAVSNLEVSDGSPKPLPPAEALVKATVDGNYSNLLAKIEVATDFQTYEQFHDFGRWNSTTYLGYDNLPVGHWVYVYPHWYIWKTAKVQGQRLEAVAQPIDADAPLQVAAIAPLQPQQKQLMLGDPFVVDQAAVVQNKAPPYDARQMVGQPDTKQAGDVSTCWAAATADSEKVWLELDYHVALPAKSIHIYENCAPGAVYQITGVNNKQKETLLWKGKDPTPTDAAKGVSKIPLKTDQTFKRFRVYLNCKVVPGWNEIDAVGLIDRENKTFWAVDARASSVYSQDVNIEFVDPFLTEEDLKAEQLAELNAQILLRKGNLRQLNQAIEQERAAINQLYQQLDELKKQHTKADPND